MLGGRWHDEDLPHLLGRMSGVLIHRGPDDNGVLLAPEMRAGLAVRRLSLVDVEHGHQPLTNEDGSVAVVCNGEIYNHRELRAALESKGHHFRTRSDVEVIVHLYEDLGIDCLQRLHGMFAVAILDRRQRRLLLARDAAGMKPLYVAQREGGIVFASEARALFASGLVQPEPNWSAVSTFLACSYVPAPQSSFAGVERLPAGGYLLAGVDSISRGAFWSYRYAEKPAPPSGGYSEELEHLLEAAVKSHLVADVPVGAFLSGGWDSSLVAVLAARHTSRLRTFSIVFPEHPILDETRWSRLVAGAIGSEHEEVEFRSADMPRLARQVVNSVEELCSTSPAPVLFALAAHAAPHVKAVLSGEGSDELFAGYAYLQNNWVYGLRRITPAAPFHALAPFAGGGKLGKLMRVLGAPSDDVADREWRRGATAAAIQSLVAIRAPNSGTELDPLSLAPEARASCTDALQRRLGIEFTKRLADGLLLVVDKVTMAHSLEARMPFLDRSIVDFALALPSDWKLRGRQEKYVLKGMTHLLPPALARRRKQGLRNPSPMGSPQSRAWVRDVLLEGGKRSGLFHLAALEPWLSQMGRSLPVHHTAWTLVNLQLWWECFFATPARTAVPAS